MARDCTLKLQRQVQISTTHPWWPHLGYDHRDKNPPRRDRSLFLLSSTISQQETHYLIQDKHENINSLIWDFLVLMIHLRTPESSEVQWIFTLVLITTTHPVPLCNDKMQDSSEFSPWKDIFVLCKPLKLQIRFHLPKTKDKHTTASQ